MNIKINISINNNNKTTKKRLVIMHKTCISVAKRLNNSHWLHFDWRKLAELCSEEKRVSTSSLLIKI